MVLKISILSLTKIQGNFLVKPVDWKMVNFPFFLQKNPVEIYRGLQGAKMDHVNSVEWVQIEIYFETNVLYASLEEEYT